MSLGKKTGFCKICKRASRTEWHHIISQHHSIKTGQVHLLHNPDNVIELCIRCHKQTTASMVRKRLTRINGPITRTRPKRLSAEEKRNAKEKIRVNKKKQMYNSLEKMSERDAATTKKIQTPTRTIKRLRRFFPGEIGDIRMKMLYPPDHWLHSAENYIPSMSKRFERDWLWAPGGGAIMKDWLRTQD